MKDLWKLIHILVFLPVVAVLVIPCYIAGFLAWIIVSAVLKGWDSADTLGDD